MGAGEGSAGSVPIPALSPCHRIPMYGVRHLPTGAAMTPYGQRVPGGRHAAARVRRSRLSVSIENEGQGAEPRREEPPGGRGCAPGLRPWPQWMPR